MEKRETEQKKCRRRKNFLNQIEGKEREMEINKETER